MATQGHTSPISLDDLLSRIEVLEKELAQEKRSNSSADQNINEIVNGIRNISDEGAKILSGLVQGTAEGIITQVNLLSGADSSLSSKKDDKSGKSSADIPAIADITNRFFKLVADVPRNSINKFFEVYKEK